MLRDVQQTKEDMLTVLDEMRTEIEKGTYDSLFILMKNVDGSFTSGECFNSGTVFEWTGYLDFVKSRMYLNHLSQEE